MQSAGPGLQLLIYYGALPASRQEQERQPGGVLQGPGPGANTVSDKSINTGDLQTHNAAPLPNTAHHTHRHRHTRYIHHRFENLPFPATVCFRNEHFGLQEPDTAYVMIL